MTIKIRIEITIKNITFKTQDSIQGGDTKQFYKGTTSTTSKALIITFGSRKPSEKNSQSLLPTVRPQSPPLYELKSISVRARPGPASPSLFKPFLCKPPISAKPLLFDSLLICEQGICT